MSLKLNRVTISKFLTDKGLDAVKASALSDFIEAVLRSGGLDAEVKSQTVAADWSTYEAVATDGQGDDFTVNYLAEALDGGFVNYRVRVKGPNFDFGTGRTVAGVAEEVGVIPAEIVKLPDEVVEEPVVEEVVVVEEPVVEVVEVEEPTPVVEEVADEPVVEEEEEEVVADEPTPEFVPEEEIPVVEEVPEVVEPAEELPPVVTAEDVEEPQAAPAPKGKKKKK